MTTSKEMQIEEIAIAIPSKIIAYNGDPKGQHLYIEQRREIAEALYYLEGYRKQSEWISVEERATRIALGVVERFALGDVS